jgi:hypothetical protein
MQQDITAKHAITIGLDVSDRFSEAYAIDDEGEWIESLRLQTTPPSGTELPFALSFSGAAFRRPSQGKGKRQLRPRSKPKHRGPAPGVA